MLRSRGSTAASYHRVEDGEYEALENEGFDSYYDAAVAAIGRDGVNDPHSTSDPPAAASNARRVSIAPDDGDPLMRTVSSEGSVQLSHPTPDLQSVQGAYVGNIERLEHSAEQMSLNSDLEEEIRRLKLEQRRSESRRSSVAPASRQYSTQSFSNSIASVNRVARSGGFSPEAYVASPIGSFMSPPWSSRSLHEQTAPAMEESYRRPEPESEGLPLDSPMSIKPMPLTVRNSTSQELGEDNGDPHADYLAGLSDKLGVQERAPSAASGDTFQRAEKEFEAFDGVHGTAGNQEHQDTDLEAPRNSRVYADAGETLGSRASMPPPPPRDDMVFYPAPVPMMLNLPQRLSRAPPASKVAQRKSEVLQAAMANNRKSAPMLGVERASDRASNHPSEASKRTSELPPQLRATMFFDHDPVHHEVQVAQGSAVATLDSILDASAYAPVSAFTDHPIAGHLGNEVYGGLPGSSRTKPSKPKRHTRNASSLQQLSDRKSTSPPLPSPNRGISMVMEVDGGTRDLEGIAKEGDDRDSKSRASLGHDAESLPSPNGNRWNAKDAIGTQEYDEADQAEEDIEDDEDAAMSGRPTTLLAELQLRKTQQQQRNRTAANAFPNGMHSTLLEMDAVAQIQKQARRQKHVTLAWENADAARPQDDAGDEDVPLGVLYPGKAAQKINDPVAQWDEDRPRGLLAQRAMEDSEPLSRRRARLVGGTAGAKRYDEAKRASTLDLLASAQPAEEDDDEKGETLAQRKQRLKNQQRIEAPRAVSSDFASEMLSQFGGPKPAGPALEPPAAGPATSSKTPDPDETLGQRRKRLLAEKEARARAALGAATKRRSMADLLQANPVGARHGPAAHVPGIAPSGLVGALDGWQRPAHARDPHRTPHGAAAAPRGPAATYVNPMSYAPMMGVHGGVAGPAYAEAAAAAAEHVVLNPAQRAMIDRWRQSVV